MGLLVLPPYWCSPTPPAALPAAAAIAALKADTRVPDEDEAAADAAHSALVKQVRLRSSACSAGALSCQPDRCNPLRIQVRDKRRHVMAMSRLEKGKNRPTAPAVRRKSITAAATIAKFEALGMPGAGERILASASAGTKRGRSATRRGSAPAAGEEAAAMGDDAGSVGARSAGAGASPGASKRSRSIGIAARGAREGLSEAAVAARARSKSRALSAAPPEKQGLPSAAAAAKDRKSVKRVQRLKFRGVAGESDRAIPAKMPKHLYSGKRGIGKTDWR